MRRALGAMLGTMAIALPAGASPERLDWEPYLGPATPSAEVFFHWLGSRPTPDTSDATGRHYLIGDRNGYPGGIDAYVAPDGTIQEILFYLAEGPLYLDSQIQRAAKAKTVLKLEDIRRWYGKPDEEATSSRTGATVWTYHVQGDPTRTLTIGSLPHSPCVHRIIVTRGSD